MSQDEIYKYISKYEGKTPKEISTDLKLAKNTVSSQLHSLRKKKMIKFKKTKHSIEVFKEE